MTFDEIKSHPHFPFCGFRDDDLEFLMLELYWVEVFRGIVGSARAVAWKPLFPADREEGNPMLHLIERSTPVPRMLRIIQRFNTGGLPELNLDTKDRLMFRGDAYLPFVPGLTWAAVDPETLGPAEELVISSDVTPACERFLRWFLTAWCVDRISVADMDGGISKYWAQVNARLVPAA